MWTMSSTGSLPEHPPARINLIRPTRLAAIIPEFESALSEEGGTWIDERRRKTAFFDDHLTMEGIAELDEGALHELIGLLGAFRNWTNQEWLYHEILKSGLETVKDALWQLLYGDDLLEGRFDFVKAHIRMMGAAAISELLALHDPTVYPIWNRRARRGLLHLGISEALLPRSTQISGAQYAAYAHLMQWVLAEVQVRIPAVQDMLGLDQMFSHLALHDLPADPPLTLPAWREEQETFYHNEVIDQLLQLGDGLGFEVDKEVAILPGCRLDVVWRTRIANLGTITYGFEVHRKGSRDSAIMNLQRVSAHPTVQKVVFVARRDDLEMFRREISALPDAFRGSVAYFDVADLQRALDHLLSLKGILGSLGLMGASGLFE